MSMINDFIANFEHIEHFVTTPLMQALNNY